MIYGGMAWDVRLMAIQITSEKAFVATSWAALSN